jgi:hypothetical protein
MDVEISQVTLQDVSANSPYTTSILIATQILRLPPQHSTLHPSFFQQTNEPVLPALVNPPSPNPSILSTWKRSGHHRRTKLAILGCLLDKRKRHAHGTRIVLAEVVETPLKKTQDLLLRTGPVASFLKNPYSTTPLSPYLPILRLFRFIE